MFRVSSPGVWVVGFMVYGSFDPNQGPGLYQARYGSIARPPSDPLRTPLPSPSGAPPGPLLSLSDPPADPVVLDRLSSPRNSRVVDAR
eukprot:1136700-Prorocentrum_minimum.AAC.1